MITLSTTRTLAAVGLMLALATPAWAQQNAETPSGGQDLAPAGGLTVQEGTATTPTACPNGAAPSVASESSSSFQNSSLSSVMTSSVSSSAEGGTSSEPAGDVTCPGASDTGTVNNGTDASDTTMGSSAPAMK